MVPVDAGSAVINLTAGKTSIEGSEVFDSDLSDNETPTQESTPDVDNSFTLTEEAILWW